VLVIGGGLVGCETADYLASQSKNVTLVEMLKHTARDIGPAARFFLRKRLKERQVKILTQTTVKSISDDAVVVDTPGVEQRIVPFDTIVLAAGATSINELEVQLKGLVPEIYVIGDAVKPGKILAAVEKAAEVGLKL
jgi:pyruvate/2-oxoglutarate dehydrogenase complex dihydrolipoamide dehydrogenase (E3) component